jgi:hypothetical protein
LKRWGLISSIGPRLWPLGNLSQIDGKGRKSFGKCSEFFFHEIEQTLILYYKTRLKAWSLKKVILFNKLHYLFTIATNTTKPFSIDNLLKAATVREEDFASFENFLTWAKVTTDTISVVTVDKLERLATQYSDKKDPNFSLGFYAELIANAALIWSRSSGIDSCLSNLIVYCRKTKT